MNIKNIKYGIYINAHAASEASPWSSSQLSPDTLQGGLDGQVGQQCSVVLGL